MPWMAAAQFTLPDDYHDCTDYAVGWVDDASFFVFFTNDGDLYRIEGLYDGNETITYVEDAGQIVVTDLGPVTGVIVGLARLPGGQFSIFTESVDGS